MSVAVAEGHMAEFQDSFRSLQKEVGNTIVGNEDVIQLALTSLLAGGHALLEGVPGLGKTSLVHALADALDLTFSRIQFTPDLMPGDILGTHVVEETESGGRTLMFRPGPLFAHVILADEINRATPRTQSALLEAMQEQTITVGTTSHELEKPFLVLATQNPLEMEGTYPLPEAQLDRFLFKLEMEYPSDEELHEILERTTAREMPKVKAVADGASILAMREMVRAVPVAPNVRQYAISLTRATDPTDARAPEPVRRLVRHGGSPRAVQAMVLGAKVRALLDNRSWVSCDDIAKIAGPALSHRVLLNFEGQAEGASARELVLAVIESVPVPAD